MGFLAGIFGFDHRRRVTGGRNGSDVINGFRILALVVALGSCGAGLGRGFRQDAARGSFGAPGRDGRWTRRRWTGRRWTGSFCCRDRDRRYWRQCWCRCWRRSGPLVGAGSQIVRFNRYGLPQFHFYEESAKCQVQDDHHPDNKFCRDGPRLANSSSARMHRISR
jgi:hypothetical protein